MKLKTKVDVALVAAIVAIVVIGLSCVQEYQWAEDSVSANRTLDDAVRAVYELNTLAVDFQLHHTERAAKQWLLRYSSLATLLDTLEASSTIRTAVDDIRRLRSYHADLHALFLRLATLLGTEGGGPEPTPDVLEQAARIEGQLNLKAQALLSDVLALAATGDQSVLASQRRQGMVFALGAVLFLLAVGLGGVLFRRAVLVPLLHVCHGANLVAAGNLAHRLQVRSRDEIGVLGEDFNQMAASLEKSFDAMGVEIANRKRAEEELAKRTSQLEAVRAVSEEITRELHLPTLLRLIHQRVGELMGPPVGAIYLWDEGSQVLVPQAWRGLGAWFEGVRFRLGEGVVGTVAQRREGMIVNDYPTSPYAYLPILERITLTAALAEPLLYRDRLVGVIMLSHTEAGRQFTQDDRDVLALFAAQAATTLENARLHSAAVQRGEQLETLLRATHSIMSDLNLESILDRIVAEAAQIARTPHVTVMLVDKAAQILRVAAMAGDPVPEGFSVPLGLDLSGLVAQTGQPVFSADSPNDPRNLLGQRDRELGFLTYLGLPIKARDEVLGVLTFDTTTPRNYTPTEVAYLESFAAHAAIAIENARLYDAAQREITARKRLEEERIALEAQLRQQQKLEALGTMAGGVAHEINNPIAGIMNYAQLIVDTVEPTSQPAEYAAEIVQETQRVATIVRNLLQFARQERQTHSPARLADIVEQTLSLFRAVLRHDQIALTVDVPEGLPPLKCRSQQLQQVLMNLLTNARDALNAKYPGYHADKTIRVTARPFDHDGRPWLRLTVADQGPGIPPEIQPRIFDPFFTTKPRDKGSGLGLSISHGVVKDHQGVLHFETEPGVGTQFHLDLPVDNGWTVEEE